MNRSKIDWLAGRTHAKPEAVIEALKPAFGPEGQWLNASRRKALATARDPHASDVHRKAVTLDLPTLERWAEYARAVEAQATHQTALRKRGGNERAPGQGQ